MKPSPKRLFLDTNIYIIGAATADTPEAQLLHWAGFGRDDMAREQLVAVILSAALIEQITRVARRLQHKDWAGAILSEIWQSMNVQFVMLDPVEVQQVEARGIIPREDVTVFLSAITGHADCFVSANHKLIRVLAEQTGLFRCCTPEEFVAEFIEGA
jgi:predicted nucleic acid-binding protein